MIQRIQTLYLLAVAALMAAAIFTPLAYFAAGVEEYKLFAFALKSATTEYSTIYMGVIVALAAIVPFVNIFLFKNRLLQIRLCAVELVLLLGSAVFMGAYYFLSNRMFSQLEFSAHGMHIAIIFPLIAIILDYLALRAIFKDEMLVKSLDRIR
ncbi:MAG: DUF4293 domain-containing protein [Rikenellaceae bacterium]|nr:DUF4293 domain-containing protein [Rikenellaceae bacterium]